MTGGSLGLRTGSYGSLQQQVQNGGLQSQHLFVVRKPSKMSLSGSREKERYLCRRKVGMLILVLFALLAFMAGFFTVNKDTSEATSVVQFNEEVSRKYDNFHTVKTLTACSINIAQWPPPALRSSAVSLHGNPCKNFAFPPPPPGDRRRPGPRPCPVCYLPVEQAIASMPSSPSALPVLRHITYYHDEHPIKTEPHGGSDFGGYPSLKQRNESFNIKESMTVHCGFVKGCRPGHQTGFDIDLDDLRELEQFHEVIVASAIFGNYDVIQQPKNIGDTARKKIPFFMFIDEETEAYMKNASVLNSTMRVGLWKIIIVHNIPYTDARRNGKDIPLEHIGQESADLSFRRFDVFEEAEANKAAGKYDNASIDYQINFYKNDGLTPYSEAKLPITSGRVLNLRDQLSFSTVRDKIMAQVNWSVNMFMDCERRNFVLQAYHRDLLEQMAPPARGYASHPPPALVRGSAAGRTPVKKNPIRRKGDKRSVSRRHRKVIAGNRDNTLI
ncbi:hypothetical protein RJ640_004455 [Escallonia rubra]|uniref:TOD1/MUCI70 glycosyltransferase-like domain-containing protein n=1 Tax=Escallonia rubra TaxID=112253 RepID=A0AA88QDM8_9ASTE|nr:hypothetical protein RJ640_004455 [Escallonia rubra]